MHLTKVQQKVLQVYTTPKSNSGVEQGKVRKNSSVASQVRQLPHTHVQLACRLGHKNVIKMLMPHCDVLAQDELGNSALIHLTMGVKSGFWFVESVRSKAKGCKRKWAIQTSGG